MAGILHGYEYSIRVCLFGADQQFAGASRADRPVRRPQDDKEWTLVGKWLSGVFAEDGTAATAGIQQATS